MSTVSPARALALNVTRQVRERKAYAQNLIATQVDTADISRVDRAFATLLIVGVISTEGLLDQIIDRNLKSPRDVQPDVRDSLRISTYETVFLDKSAHAAVDQGVELARSVAPRAGGLANAVLRKITQDVSEFPWGDPETDDGALARSHAFPDWLARRLIDDLGRQRAAKLMEASNQQAPLYLAVNPLKATDVEVLSALENAGADPALIGAQGGGCIVARNAVAVVTGSLLKTGKVLVSDASAQIVARLATPGILQPYLEVGSGRGTKTILLQGKTWRAFGKQARIFALDIYDFKRDILSERIQQFGLEGVTPVVGDVLDLDTVVGTNEGFPQQFGGALIDAPCSGLGTLRRHPEQRWSITPAEITAMAQRGQAMLAAVSRVIAPGGFIVYATCTVLREENEAVIESFLASDEGSEFHLASIADRDYLQIDMVPGGPDAHFAARLVRDR